MNTYTIELRDADEIEQFYLQTTGMKPGFLQLSAGPMNLRSRVVELAGVTLIWTSATGHARWTDEMTGEGLHFAIALEAESPVLSAGRELRHNSAQVWLPGREMDLVVRGPYTSLDIGVSHDLVMQLGWEIRGDPLRDIPEPALKNLVNVTSSIEASRRQPQVAGPGPIFIDRDRVLEALEAVLRPWISEQGVEAATWARSNAYALLRDSDVFFSQHDGGTFEVSQLEARLGVPRRTLFHAFRKTLGVGPRRYFEQQRLQTLQRRLKQHSSQTSTVTRLATELGFVDMGRLAARYRQQFGEYPRQTLLRAS